MKKSQPQLVAAIGLALACLLLVTTVHSQSGEFIIIPMQDELEERATPLVRGAMDRVQLKKDGAYFFSFATDGPGLFTLCWTEAGEARNIDIHLLGFEEDPQSIDKPIQKGIKGTHIYTMIQPLKKARIYYVWIRSKADQTIHLGHTWLPLPEIDEPDVNYRVTDLLPKCVRHASVNLLVPQRDKQPHPSKRDPNHWLEGFPKVPLGYTANYNNESGRPKTFHHPVDGPGILTLGLRAKDQRDMALAYESQTLQPKVKGHHDDDHFGYGSIEHVAVCFPGPDNIAVRVVPLGGGGEYAFSGTWLSLAGVADEPR